MNWLQKIAVSLQIVTSGPSGTHVWIDGKDYWYLGEEPARNKLEALWRAGQHGAAIQLLRNAFDLLETPRGIVEGI